MVPGTRFPKRDVNGEGDEFPHRGVWLLVALAATYLLVFGFRNGPFMDSDEGIFGLMARHIAFKHELPVYYWGQEYLGAFESYLAAPLIWAFGSYPQILRVITIGFYLAFVLAATDVAFMAKGRRLALITAAVFVAPPVAYTVWATKMHMFTEAGEASFVLLWAALRMARCMNAKRQGLWAAGLGLGIGIGVWWSYLVAVYLVPAALVVLAIPNARKPRLLAVALVFALVGASPALYRNAFETHWATFVHAVHPDPGQARSGQPDHAVPKRAVKNLREIALPALLGVHDARTRPYTWTLPQDWLGLLFSLVVIGGMGLCLGEGLRRGKPPLARLAALGPLLGGLAMVGLYVFSRFGFEPEPRYLMPLYLAVGCMNAWAIDGLFTLRRELGGAALLGLMAFQFHRTFMVEPAVKVAEWNPSAAQTVSYAALAKRLEELGKTHIRADYWTAVPLTFESGEKVLAADPSGRTTPYNAEIAADPHACLLTTPNPRIDALARRPGVERFDFGPEIPGLGRHLVLLCP